MKQKCIEAVSKALGRQISQAESVKIEERILKNMRQLQRENPEGWRGMPAADRLRAAAGQAAGQLVNEAKLKRLRVELSVKAAASIDNYISQQRAKGMTGLESLRRTLVFVADGKSDRLSAESRAKAIEADNIRQLIDTFESVDPKFWGLMESNEGIAVLTREIFGENTGNAVAKKGAAAWKKVADDLKKQFNALGGDIGELEDWNLPQHHSQMKINKAGVDQWVSDIFSKLNRSKYVNEDGSLFSDTQLYDFLRGAWETLATGGINKIEPGVKGSSMVANRHRDSRQIHFKDADSYLEYQQQYGEKSLWGVITGHVNALSKEVAMLETYGPNPDNTFKTMLDKHLRSDAMADPKKTGKASREAKRLSSLYDFVAGKVDPIVNEHLATTFDTLRNWLVSSRLGSAAITAISDEATIHLTAKVNNLPEMQLIQNELRAFNPADAQERALAQRAGLGLDVMLNNLNRWGQDTLGQTFSSKMAHTVMRASGLEALDGARRRAFGATYMSALGEMTRKYYNLSELDPTDNRILLSKGITENDWSVWRLAELEDWGGGVLTPESIMRIPDQRLANMGNPKQLKRDATLRLLGVVLEETDMAVIRPGAEERFISGAAMQRGTWKGELTRSFFLFKSFPIAMIRRHWMRGYGMETAGGKAAYIASLVIGTTLLGAVSQTVNDLLQGKNPRNYNPAEEFGWRNWMAAFLKGGSLGIYGDFLFSGATNHGQQGPIASLLGPVAGLVEDSYNLTQGNIIEALQGKDTNFGAELVRFVKSNTPGANLWYAKAALDHLIFHQLQEYFSPGYLRRMERRTRNEFGQTYYWQPGADFSEMDAPDFNKAIGE
jgi:hypothetical protein